MSRDLRLCEQSTVLRIKSNGKERSEGAPNVIPSLLRTLFRSQRVKISYPIDENVIAFRPVFSCFLILEIPPSPKSTKIISKVRDSCRLHKGEDFARPR